MPVTKAQAKAAALAFPGAHEKLSFRKPAIFVDKKFFTRIRERDDSIVMRVGSIEQRDMMLELDPETYFITAHYKDWAGVLVRLSAISPGELKIMLERVWRQVAPRKLQREVDAAAAPPVKKTTVTQPAATKKAVRTKPVKAKKANVARKAKR